MRSTRSGFRFASPRRVSVNVSEKGKHQKMVNYASINNPFSYVDSALSVAYYNISAQDEIEKKHEFEEVSKLHDIDRGEYLSRIQNISLELLFHKYRTTYFHEWHHCLQNIFYPYRYLQSWRELSIALNLLSELRNANYDISLPSIDFDRVRLELPAPWRNTITYPSMVHCFDIDDNGFLSPTERDITDLRPNDLTLTDLIEDATSIFEYKVQIGAVGTGEGYRKWIRSGNKVYANTFRLLAKLLGVNDAYVALPPLVQLAFHTTWPMTVFMNYANFLKNYKDRLSSLSPLGIDFVYSILLNKLANDELFPAGKPDVNMPTQYDKALFISPLNYEQIVNETQTHSIYSLALRYISLSQNNGYKILAALFHPYDIDTWRFLGDTFLPPVTGIRIYNSSFKARDTLFIVSKTLKDEATPFAPDISYSDYLPELIKRKDIAYSLCTDLNMLFDHNCHHYECPYYRTNICRRWTAIPKIYTKCGFPDWFRITTGKNINLKNRSLSLFQRESKNE